MTSSSTQSQEKQKVRTATPWSVIVYDDPVNLMAYVTMVLIKIFGYNKSKAETLMLEIHNAGKSIVWAGEKEKAELYVQQLHSYQLQASLEKAD
ncbi:ATP-dependent Clp protease adaptor protein ClpS [Rubritalea squalenifaciens DSM 18772]|uniref:ATP-dependent Clp protease adapter protein ClpS n=1 Tax=Rubritalea squalenifaciens DSM 18772 TaxID=1123071 RepID=A0A1M6P7I0_9BACT|nr:ATP-dependent Clp protease adapter ClpS [Rubritalea squalenifaciens]SHK03904.1 ATP-dependent Clp protease adaptor protein ClpS [Rubritalea squalenifaciens DSM 18772]